MFGSFFTKNEMISVEELVNLLKTEKINLLDVRTKEEYDMGHIKEAKLFPLDIISTYENSNKDEAVYVICRSGARSANAQKILLQKGYKAINVKGGMLAYENLK